jgi:hypothetical protein
MEAVRGPTRCAMSCFSDIFGCISYLNDAEAGTTKVKHYRLDRIEKQWLATSASPPTDLGRLYLFAHAEAVALQAT